MEQGKYYHVYNRGNNREPIFFEEINYQYFLDRFNYYVAEYVDVFAYCLMSNHFHFFIRVEEYDENNPRKSVSKAFKNFFISYAKSVNKKYSRTGNLFQSKFKRKEFVAYDDFCRIILYIHQNPVKAGLCITCNEWKYSSYTAIISNKISKICVAEVLEWFLGKECFIKAHLEPVSI